MLKNSGFCIVVKRYLSFNYRNKCKRSLCTNNLNIENETVFQVRENKRNEFFKNKINPYPHQFNNSHTPKELIEKYSFLQNGSEINTDFVSISGRVIFKRVFGKLMFFTLKYELDQIQLYVDKKILNKQFDFIQKMTDIGDIIGVNGTIKRTDKGELSVLVREYQMLSKSLLPLPDKHFGLQDTNKRYRQRHIDMIIDDSVKKVFLQRSEIIYQIRDYLHSQGFIEVETPILSTISGGAEAKPFITKSNALDQDLSLRIATELYLKRFIIGGFNKIFEIGKIFRNEGLSLKHNPEFTSIEIYQTNSDYNDMIILVENIFNHIQKHFKHNIVSPPWKRVSMMEIVNQTVNLNLLPYIENFQAAKQLVQEKKLLEESQLSTIKTSGELLNALFEVKCEHLLQQPTVIIDYPVEISPLSKRKRLSDGEMSKYFVERFEIFINGNEIANGFTELNDPIEQYERFLLQVYDFDLIYK